MSHVRHVNQRRVECRIECTDEFDICDPHVSETVRVRQHRAVLVNFGSNEGKEKIVEMIRNFADSFM